MNIANAQGQVIGFVVVESVEQQKEVEAALSAQGYRLVEPPPPEEPISLERGGDLEADNCDVDRSASDPTDNCSIAVVISYTEEWARRNGVRSPKLHAIVDRGRVESSAEAREAMEEFVGIMEAGAGANLSAADLKDAYDLVYYAYKDLAARLPQPQAIAQ